MRIIFNRDDSMWQRNSMKICLCFKKNKVLNTDSPQKLVNFKFEIIFLNKYGEERIKTHTRIYLLLK